MTDSDSISFEQLGISEVLKRYELKVPQYQRDYSWDKEYVEAYLQDLSLAINQDEPTYFIGSLVVIDRGENLREVVDGQQRLATTSLLLAAIKHLSDTSSNIHRAVDQFLVSLDLDTIDQPKMTLNSSDVNVFSSLVTKGIPGEGFVTNRQSHKRLVKAYKDCADHIRSASALVNENQRGDVYERWIKYLQFNTQCILINVSSELNAFRMFETLNDRGLKVSQADLIKNYLFSQAGSKLETAQGHWTSMKSSLEAIDDEQILVNFIRHVLMASNNFVQRKNIYKDIQSIAKGENSAIALLAKLDSLANNYIAINNPESSFWGSHEHTVKDHLRAILVFDIQPLKPMLLSASSKLDTKQSEKIFRFAISMSVRLTIASASRPTSMAVEKPISEMAVKIWSGDVTSAKDAINGLTKVIPNDSVFRDEFLSATVSKSQLARYYLRTMERAHKGEPNPEHIPNEDPSSVNLEHILPQKPNDEWAEFTDEDVDTYRNRIGNLAILKSSDNLMVGSEGFESKRAAYAKSTYGTTSMVSKYDSWNADSIKDRQEKLFEFALKSWPL